MGSRHRFHVHLARRHEEAFAMAKNRCTRRIIGHANKEPIGNEGVPMPLRGRGRSRRTSGRRGFLPATHDANPSMTIRDCHSICLIGRQYNPHQCLLNTNVLSPGASLIACRRLLVPSFRSWGCAAAAAAGRIALASCVRELINHPSRPRQRYGLPSLSK